VCVNKVKAKSDVPAWMELVNDSLFSNSNSTYSVHRIIEKTKLLLAFVKHDLIHSLQYHKFHRVSHF
jgi:hypothetical protein